MLLVAESMMDLPKCQAIADTITPTEWMLAPRALLVRRILELAVERATPVTVK